MNTTQLLDQTEETQQADLYSEISKEEYEAFVGDKANYYLPKWEKFNDKKITGFNVFAFLFGLLWMLYKKMYFTFFIVLAFTVAEGALEEVASYVFGTVDGIVNGISRLITILVSIILGVYGNWLYLREVKSKILKIRAKGLDHEEYFEELRRRGGSNLTLLSLALVAIIIAIIIFASISN